MHRHDIAPRSAARARSVRAVLALVLALVPAGAGAQGVSVSVTPAAKNVPPGGTFELDLNAAAGAAFNGFDFVVGFDPAALTFVGFALPDSQQGCLMTGGCSAACGNTFHVFNSAGDSVSIHLSLLCDQVFVSGPGQLYKLKFRASSTQQVTNVTLRRADFYDAGLFVTPVGVTGGQVTIVAPSDVGFGVAAQGLRLRAGPSPARGPVLVAIESDAAGEQILDVIDPSGRLVRRLADGWQGAGSRTASWDGTDALGARVPPGLYLVRLRSGGRLAETRVIVLR